MSRKCCWADRVAPNPATQRGTAKGLSLQVTSLSSWFWGTWLSPTSQTCQFSNKITTWNVECLHFAGGRSFCSHFKDWITSHHLSSRSVILGQTFGWALQNRPFLCFFMQSFVGFNYDVCVPILPSLSSVGSFALKGRNKMRNPTLRDWVRLMIWIWVVPFLHISKLLYGMVSDLMFEE